MTKGNAKSKKAGAISNPVAEDRKQAKVVVVEDEEKNQLMSVGPSKRSDDENLPICYMLGNFYTGKTKLLDRIRETNIQQGAEEYCSNMLFIDQQSFNNSHSWGSALLCCDIAILVVNIMRGFEPQTRDLLNLLKTSNKNFIIALNKVDMIPRWKACPNAPIRVAVMKQNRCVQADFHIKVFEIIAQFKSQGLNTELYYLNKSIGETFSIVPTGAISGEGIPDMLFLMSQWTQKTMIEKFTYSENVQCTVLQVKVIEGYGTTIDVVLVNGVLHEGDQIVVSGMQGLIVTTIRALLTPHPMKELCVKGSFIHHKEIKAVRGIKIIAQGLEHAISGASLYMVKPDDDLEYVKKAAFEDVELFLRGIDSSGDGVYVQASTPSSLEALLEFLITLEVNIPVSATNIGPVHTKDVMKAGVMLGKKQEYATILAFDVKITLEASQLADDLGVRIFSSNVIDHLFRQFKDYMDGIKAYMDYVKEEKERESVDEEVFPCMVVKIPI